MTAVCFFFTVITGLNGGTDHLAFGFLFLALFMIYLINDCYLNNFHVFWRKALAVPPVVILAMYNYALDILKLFITGN